MSKKIRNTLLKSFVLAYILVFLSYIIYHFAPNHILGFIEKAYGISALDAKLMIAYFHSFVKMFAVTFFLVPALAIHCEFMSKCCMRHVCETVESQKKEQPN